MERKKGGGEGYTWYNMRLLFLSLSLSVCALRSREEEDGKRPGILTFHPFLSDISNVT